MPPTQRSFYDIANSDFKSVVNQTITNSALFWASSAFGLDDKVFSSYDSDAVGAGKLAVYSSVINQIGGEIRKMYPQLVLFK